ncbi:MAG: DUF1343 domain-containing protein [Acetobacter sp.]|jgi:uncharacterized protein YbbC (DUF1343 family)|nr:DUF1343 domain-containing protein [Acetobacter sp.]MCH4062689.1 DUF1343 domain-containing protein [Acetobacter sp.]MCH4088465.1 DUF1343 domain-containing protein [Acetobacter sp.]MCI1294621.1 DUF1343 domain-containing protein [Acetobacter sp.]MCI1321329.1 DUF1343 domain-containing protein [Acetobacter sp.]
MTKISRRLLGKHARQIIVGLGGASVTGISSSHAKSHIETACTKEISVKTGFEKLRETDFSVLKGHKIGVVANVSSVDNSLKSIVDCLHEVPFLQLKAIFGPEHGFRGSMRAGFSEPERQDPETGCTVYDIYMKNGDVLKNIINKSDIDMLVFDIQDTGSRFYTYIWTLFDCLIACAALNIPVLVLDRPNPISGIDATGPVLDPSLSSFVGRAPIALRHGMTVAELALLFNAAFIPQYAGKSADLQIMRMEGWQRHMQFEDTGLTWCPPSPNMPSPLTALAYPGTCLFEGTQFSVGRGTTMPFLYLGNPAVDGRLWADFARSAHCTGVQFRDVWFTPLMDPFKGVMLHGLHCAITDTRNFDPINTGMTLLSTGRKIMGPDFWRDNGKTFDRLCGNRKIRPLLDKGADAASMSATWQPELTTFRTLRQAHLLYSA